MRRGTVVVGAATGVLLLSRAACANMGTPLMLAAALHLLFGNAIIGVGEGLLLMFVFRRRLKRVIPLMILANYFSCLIGVLLMGPMQYVGGILPLRWLGPSIVAGVVLLVALTALLEWPFVGLCFRKTKNAFRRSLVASLVLQLGSYAVLVGWYSLTSWVTLLTETKEAASLDFLDSLDATVYFVGLDGGLYRMQLADRGEPVKMSETHAAPRDTRLVFQPGTEPGTWQLSERFDAEEMTPLMTIRADRVVPQMNDDPDMRARWRPYDRYGDVVDMRPKDEREWTFGLDFQRVGMTAKNEATGEIVRLSLETPLITLTFGGYAVLPGDVLIIQLNERICVLDFHNRTLTQLARGREPVVVMGESAAPVQETARSPGGENR